MLEQTIKELTAFSSPSGFEQDAAEYIKNALSECADSVRSDNMGNVIAVKKCGKKDASKMLIEAHMDEVGFIVTEICEGFLKFSLIGGVDPRLLPGREVTVLADKPVYGVIACLPPHVLTEEEREKAVKVKNLYIDIGMAQEAAEEAVKPGDFGVFRSEPFKTENGKFFCSKALDDRACVAIMLETARSLKTVSLDYDIYYMASVQEELGMRGAQTGAFSVEPDYCIAIDVTHAKTPDASSDETYGPGCGCVIDVGPNMNRRFSSALISCCKENEIPYAIEVDPRSSGTDAWPIQVSRCGVCTAVLSVPIKYMHSPGEMLKLSDAEESVKLLTKFLSEFNEGRLG
jgi:endoglucanase